MLGPCSGFTQICGTAVPVGVGPSRWTSSSPPGSVVTLGPARARNSHILVAPLPAKRIGTRAPLKRPEVSDELGR
jgi:hypothetical protein